MWPIPEWVQDVVNTWQVVLGVYVVILIPLGLVVYHDIVDSHWRRYQWAYLYWWRYTVFFFLTTVVVVTYFSLNFVAMDTSEAAAALLALVLGGYVVLKMKRLHMIFKAHRLLCDVVNVVRGTANTIFPGTDRASYERGAAGDGFETMKRASYDRGAAGDGFETMKRRRRPHEQRIHHRPPDDDLLDDQETSTRAVDQEKRFEYMSNNLFDDDYPGAGGPRVRWYRFQPIEVDPEDGDSCITRVGLYIRMAARRTRADLSTCLSATNKLVIVRKYRPSLGKTLRRICMYGTYEQTPRHARSFPAPRDKTSKEDIWEPRDRENSLYNVLDWFRCQFQRCSAEANRRETVLQQRKRCRDMIRNPSESLLNLNLNLSGKDEGNVVRRLIRKFPKIGACVLTDQHHTTPESQPLGLLPDECDRLALKKIGVELFWIAAEESDDEVASAMTLFPQRWKRGSKKSGKELLFEIATLLILQYDTAERGSNHDNQQHAGIHGLDGPVTSVIPASEDLEAIDKALERHQIDSDVSDYGNDSWLKFMLTPIQTSGEQPTETPEDQPTETDRDQSGRTGTDRMKEVLCDALSEFLEMAQNKRELASSSKPQSEESDISPSASSSKPQSEESDISPSEQPAKSKEDVKRLVDMFFEIAIEKDFVEKIANPTSGGVKFPGRLIAFAIYELIVTATNAAKVTRALFEEPEQRSDGSSFTGRPPEQNCVEKSLGCMFHCSCLGRVGKRDLEQGPATTPQGETLSALEDAMKRRNLQYTPETFMHSEIVSGFCSILQRLGFVAEGGNSASQTETIRSAVRGTMKSWKKLSPFSDDPLETEAFNENVSVLKLYDDIEMDASDMFGSLARLFRQGKSHRRLGMLSASNWLLNYDEPADASCPSHSDALRAHVDMSVFLAEGVFAILKSLQDQVEPNGYQVEFPSIFFQGTTDFWKSWKYYKQHHQGRVQSEVSTFALGFGEHHERLEDEETGRGRETGRKSLKDMDDQTLQSMKDCLELELSNRKRPQLDGRQM